MTSKKILNLIRIISLIVLAIIIGLNIYMWNANKILGDAMPMPSGFGAAVILSGSMEPALSIDDLIIVKKCDDYDIGDIIVYQRNYELIVHRIVEINGNNVIIQKVENIEVGAAKDLADRLSDKLGQSVIVLAIVSDKVVFVVKSKVKAVNAGQIAKMAAVITLGNGGGRPDFAQAGGKDVTKVDEALQAVKDELGKLL